MPTTIKWSLDVEVSQGPEISVSRNLTVDAYDKIDVAVADGDTETVAVQPSAVADVQFLLIISDQYGASLTYEVSDSSTTGATIALDAPQSFVGVGALGLLGAAPQNLEFVNSLGSDASIQIIVGRNVTS
jgi:hypothetical protein